MPKPPVKSVLVRFRAYPKELSVWKRLSRADAMTLSTWIRDSLNARLDEAPSHAYPVNAQIPHGAEHESVPFLTDRQRYSLRCLRDFAQLRLATAAPDDQNRCDPGLSWLDDLLDRTGRADVGGQPDKHAPSQKERTS